MKQIPVTPMLIAILKDALNDSRTFITDCEDAGLDNYAKDARNTLTAIIEFRKQNIAIIEDLLRRYE